MQMRAVIFDGAGGPEVIRIGEVPKPAVAPGQVRIRVHAAALNRADLVQRRGHYPAPAGWPSEIPGLEFAGEVEAVRDDVSRWDIGDRVMGLMGGGAQAGCGSGTLSRRRRHGTSLGDPVEAHGPPRANWEYT